MKGGRHSGRKLALSLRVARQLKAMLTKISPRPATAPVLTGYTTAITFAENLVNTTPQLLDADMSFADAKGEFQRRRADGLGGIGRGCDQEAGRR